MFKKFLESRQDNTPKTEKGEERWSNRTRENKKRTDRKVGSIDRPEIPDRRETLEMPGLLSGLKYSSSTNK